MKRSRGRGRRSGGGNNPNKHFESNGPDVKIRGSAQQILDKYLQYARDAQSSGDRVNAENYLQHAEHYYRVLAAMQPKDKPRDQQQDQRSGEQKSGEGGENATTDGEPSGENSSDSGKNQRNSSDRGDRGRRRRSNKNRDQVDQDGLTETVDDAEPKPAEVTVSDGGSSDAPQTVSEDAPKPKPRRRATRKPKVVEASEGDEPSDGIMKTLSRGRKPKAVPDDAVAPTSEAAD